MLRGAAAQEGLQYTPPPGPARFWRERQRWRPRNTQPLFSTRPHAHATASKKISRHLAAAPFAVLHAHALQAAATTPDRLLFCIQCGNAPITARRTIRARPDPVTRLLAVSRALMRRRSPGDAFASIVFSPRALLLAARPQSPPARLSARVRASSGAAAASARSP